MHRENVADIRRRAVAHGRGEDDVKAFAGAVVIVGRDRDDAERKRDDFLAHSSAEGYLAHMGGGGIDLAAYPRDAVIADIIAAETNAGRDASQAARRFNEGVVTVGQALDSITRFDDGPFVAIGSPTEVADAIEGWVEETGLDGFNLRQFLTPGTAEDFIEFVVPKLQERGLYRTAYAESTYRERLFGAGNTRVFDTHPAARFRGGANLGPEAGA